MSRPASDTHREYTGDGVTTAFVYPFKVDQKSDIEVRVNGAVQAESFHYVLTAIGDFNGGTVSFFTPPTAGSVVSLRLNPPFDQLLSLIPNSPLPAKSVEGTLDNIVKMIQSLDEHLSRTVSMLPGAASTLRDLTLPHPGNLKLFGWDATSSDIALYDSAIVQVTPSAVTGLAYGKTAVTVNSSAGVFELSVPALYPAGSLILGVTGRILVTFGNANGLTSVNLGDTAILDRWGAVIARTAGTVTGAGDWLRYAPFPQVGSGAGLITANGGAFDATGQIKLTAHWVTFTPDA